MENIIEQLFGIVIFLFFIIFNLDVLLVNGKLLRLGVFGPSIKLYHLSNEYSHKDILNKLNTSLNYKRNYICIHIDENNSFLYEEVSVIFGKASYNLTERGILGQVLTRYVSVIHYLVSSHNNGILIRSKLNFRIIGIIFFNISIIILIILLYFANITINIIDMLKLFIFILVSILLQLKFIFYCYKIQKHRLECTLIEYQKNI